MVFRRISINSLYSVFPWFETADGCDEFAKGPRIDDDGEHILENRTKQDDEVTLFFSMMFDRMSVESMLFILDNNIRKTLTYPETKLFPAPNDQGPLGAKKPERDHQKKLRFAENHSDQDVRTTVYEILHVADMDQELRNALWYNAEEQRALRNIANKTVRQFRRRFPKYEDSLMILAESHRDETDEILVDHHMKNLVQDVPPLGLETQLCPLARTSRSDSIKAVLQEQEKQKSRKFLQQQSSREKPHELQLQGSKRLRSFRILPKMTRKVSDMAFTKCNTNINKTDSGKECSSCDGTSLDKTENDSTFSGEYSCDYLGGTRNDCGLGEQKMLDWERISEYYSQASLPCQALAHKIGLCNRVEALKVLGVQENLGNSGWP